MSTERMAFMTLSAGQSTAYTVYNENLRHIEAMFGAVVQIRNSTPANPQEGQVWIVGTAGSGDFSGHDNQFAHWYNNAWHFYQPVDYQRHWDANQDKEVQYRVGTGWA